MQVQLAPEAREKTAFATSDGLFHYKKLPFGLHWALATCQRLMDRVLRPHWEYAAAYINNIVIHGSKWETHLNQVSAVLPALWEVGLTANPKKCWLGMLSTWGTRWAGNVSKKAEATGPGPSPRSRYSRLWGRLVTTVDVFPTLPPYPSPCQI